MEPQMSDTKAKPMRYAGFLSFLENFIFVHNQSIQVWRLKFLISTAFLIIAVAVSILFYPDNLSEAKRIEGPLDSRIKDFCKPRLPESLKVNFSGFNNHQISLPEHNTGKVESVVDLTLGPKRPNPIRRSKCSFSGPVDFSRPYTQYTPLVFSVAEQEYDIVAVDISFIGNFCLGSNQSRTPISRAGLEFQSAIYDSRHGKRLDERESTPAQVSLFNILGPNQSDPVWQLRLLAAFSLVVHATMGVLILPGHLQGVHATYQRVMLIMSFGVPIVVAVTTLLVSIWLVPDPSGRSNWITGLSVANFSLLGGRLAVYWTIKRGTENILRGEDQIELMREVI